MAEEVVSLVTFVTGKVHMKFILCTSSNQLKLAASLLTSAEWDFGTEL